VVNRVRFSRHRQALIPLSLNSPFDIQLGWFVDYSLLTSGVTGNGKTVAPTPASPQRVQLGLRNHDLQVVCRCPAYLMYRIWVR
jgi:hypothetical protein